MSERIGTVAVLGAGIMGQGIAQLVAQSGFTVLLYDISSEALDAAIAKIDAALQHRVQRRKLTSNAASAALERLRPVSDFSQFGTVDIVLEAVLEDPGVKHDLMQGILAACPSHTLVCTNTSSLSVTEIAAGSPDPSRVLGLHFFNPATVMRLVEVVTTRYTPTTSLARIAAFAAKLNKTAVTVQDSPGFVVNRCARPFYAEALVLRRQGVADVAALDACLKSNLGTPMGPFELMDLVGLDINLRATETIWDAFARHPPLNLTSPCASWWRRAIWGENPGRVFMPIRIPGRTALTRGWANFWLQTHTHWPNT